MPPLPRSARQLHRWLRSRPLLYRLTLGTRVLLAAGFIPTGMVKLLGLRFTRIGTDSPIGLFFEVMYQTGLYWRFIGLAQVLAGVLVLIPATATLGALLFLPVIANILVITVSLDFGNTEIVVALMLLATVYLLAWDLDRLRPIVAGGDGPAWGPYPRLRLHGRGEWVAYITGAVSVIGFFLGTRGLLPGAIDPLVLLATGLLSLVAAAWYGLFHRAR